MTSPALAKLRYLDALAVILKENPELLESIRRPTFMINI